MGNQIPKFNYEEYFHLKGFKTIVGLDEVGRGAWAGPLVAGAIILNKRLYGLRDSKMISAAKRKVLARKIYQTSKVGIGKVSVKELNKLKLTKGTQLAFKRALRSLGVKPDYILIDGTLGLCPERSKAGRIGCRVLIKGDRVCSSIAAASIVAKVCRDNLMEQLDKKISGYKFSKHKGYVTKLHKKRINILGLSKEHRNFYSVKISRKF